MSLWTGLQWAESNERLGAVICLSGYLPNARQFSMSAHGRDTPVFHGHGSHDALVRMQVATKTKDHVIEQKHSAKYEFKVYQRMAHSACNEEMDDLVTFLKQVLPSGPPKASKDMSIKELKEALIQRGMNPLQFLERGEMIAALEGLKSDL